MRAVLQRVSRASVTAGGEIAGAIGKGMVVMLGISKEDGEAQAELLARKTAALRIFEDETGKLNKSLPQAGGGVLVISNFTLYADCARGHRPDFASAAAFEPAEALYRRFISQLEATGIDDVRSGKFGADMKVELVNDGPVTVILDTDDWK
jgi:D-tyrosyl-tRNA(Tyr) deacylase